MKSRRTPLTRLSFVVLFLCLLSVLYYHVGLFPGRLLDKALLKIDRLTHKKVLCDKILFIPFRGFRLDHLQVRENNGALIFSANSLSINARLLPFFREKKIIIDRFVIDSPVYDYSLEPEKAAKQPAVKTVISGQVSVPVVSDNPPVDLRDIAGGPDIFLPENVYLEQIEIENGLLTIRKNRSQPPLEVVQSINVRMGFQKPPLLRFDGQLKLGKDSYAAIDLKGQWDLEKDRYDFHLSTLSREVPPWLLRYQKGNFLTLQQGQFLLKTHLISDKGDDVLFQSEAHLKDALMQVSASRFLGKMNLEAQGIFDASNKRFKNYKGRLEFVRVDALHLSPEIERLDNLVGLLDFQPDLLTVQSLRGEYKQVAFEASGAIHSFQDLILQGKIRSQLGMGELLALLPKETAEKIKDFKISGDCDAITLLSGSLKPSASIETDALLQVQNASVQNDARNIHWTALSGQLRVNAKGVEISRAHFMVSDSGVSLDAFIPKAESVPGWFRVISKNFEIRSDYTMHGSDVWLERAKASGRAFTAEFAGKLIGWDDPYLKLEGEAKISLSQLAADDSAQWPTLKSLNPQGELRGPFVLNGAWNKPLDWEFKMDAQSPLLTLRKTLPLEQFQIQIRMNNRLIHAPYLHAQFNGGKFGGRLTFDLRKPETTFDGRLYLNNVDLTKLGPQLEPAQKNLAGILLGQVALHGTLQKPESYAGQGTLSITHGLLWQTTQFKAMGYLPLVKVEGLDLVTFHEMNTTYEIHDKKIYTENLTLLGDTVNLSLRGTVSFDSELDMLMDIQYSDDVYRGAAYTGGLAPLVLQQAGGMISQYHVHGSLKEPKYDKAFLPAGRALGKKIGGLLQTITN